MPNIKEIAKSIKKYGEIGIQSNTIKEFLWVVKQITSEDIAQISEILDNVQVVGAKAILLAYAQRLLEVGYIFTEVFIRGEYENWQPTSSSPRILDLGGDPGVMSALYWKHRAPNAKVTIVEANPATVKVMNKNLAKRDIQGIEVIHAAVTGDPIENAFLHLHRPGKGYHTQDYIRDQQNGEDDSYTIKVPQVQLSSLIKDGEQIDLLKMDIEGAEGGAVKELAMSGKLSQVNRIIMEFHHSSQLWPNNSLLEMLEIFKKNDFIIEEAHITIGKGLRRKVKIPVSSIADVAIQDEKIFLTFSAVNKKNN